MESVPSHIREFWNDFVVLRRDIRDADSRFYEVFRIGSDERSANEGARLIVEGRKTATSSLLWEYESSGKPLPRVGSLSVVEDGRGAPVCVVETRAVDIRPFEEVDEAFARDYGEGDCTLEGWRELCWNFYARQCSVIERLASPDMPLVCERFRVIYS